MAVYEKKALRTQLAMYDQYKSSISLEEGDSIFSSSSHNESGMMILEGNSPRISCEKLNVLIKVSVLSLDKNFFPSSIQHSPVVHDAIDACSTPDTFKQSARNSACYIKKW